MPTSLDEALTARAVADPSDEFRPRRYEASRDRDREALRALVADGVVSATHDSITAQIADLLQSRSPSKRIPPERMGASVLAHVGTAGISQYGCWFFYPWSGRLVHVLPEDEFRELRTNRNRNKITGDEQAVLRQLRVGIVGLSVGQSAALTMVLEEICGHLRLADFDRLELSNMNRVRAGVHQLGTNKAVLAARECTEINPYFDVRVFTEGVTTSNVDEFLCGGEGRLDVVVEECDSIDVKVLLRERARAFGIPMVMETSDRGMLDLERFDREPERASFHGVLGELRAEDMRDLTPEQKIPIALDIVGIEHVSRRMAVSLIEVGSTIQTWPQLASEVALGGALTANAVRRIGLGTLLDSGRYYVDLDALVADGRGAAPSRPSSYSVVKGSPCEVSLSPLRRSGRPPSQDDVRTIVEWGITAPSGGNCQPWRFVASGNRLQCIHDAERSRSFLDFRNTASWLAFGALVENMVLAAGAMGLAACVRPEANLTEGGVVCDLELLPDASVAPDPLVHQIPARTTNRQLGSRVKLATEALERMSVIAREAGARLQWLDADDQLAAVAELIGEGDRLRLLSDRQHHEMMAEMRWTRDEAERTRDGLDVATLELSTLDLAALRLLADGATTRLLASSGGGMGLRRNAQRAIASASAVGLLTIDGCDAASFFRGGRALQRVWLTATELGLAFQPMTALAYLFQRLSHGAEELSPAEVRDYTRLRQSFTRLFTVPESSAELMIFRVARAPSPTARSLRRSTAAVLSFA